VEHLGIESEFLAFLTIVSLAGIVGLLLKERRDRLLTHQERMKALELGRDLPGAAATAPINAVNGIAITADNGRSGENEKRSVAGRCISTAFWIGFCAFVTAPGAAAISPATAIAIAGSAGAIGVTAVICGTILAIRFPPPSARPCTGSKPVTESDAFDVVSMRG
jgi:hypothetical protein